MYDLHIICGANEYVGSPEYGEDEEDYLPCAPCTFPYSHVNFLVTQKGSESAPMLYFAEFQNGRMEDQPSFCCRVDVPTPFAGTRFFLHGFLCHCISFPSCGWP
jgi:hypothetical protein